MTLYPKKINGVRASKVPVGTEAKDACGNIWVAFESCRNESISGIDVNGDCDVCWSISGNSFMRKKLKKEIGWLND
ncbi:MAG: hypothetical protein LKK07_08265 [Lactococcus lactis]|jgi:hypothetical protein|nr:hypothetical protein [Lactococcus lactis]MCI2139589.1 hypothetical protein [Lactococcus lactis]MCI2189576.1 hypothetical protein [Lactococcus lactis]